MRKFVLCIMLAFAVAGCGGRRNNRTITFYPANGEPARQWKNVTIHTYSYSRVGVTVQTGEYLEMYGSIVIED